jgi:hypothetical protein
VIPPRHANIPVASSAEATFCCVPKLKYENLPFITAAQTKVLIKAGRAAC